DRPPPRGCPRLAVWRHSMTSRRETPPPGFGRVRWRRFAMALGPATLLMVLMLVLTEQSVLAVSISISGEPFTVTATQLHGEGFEQFGVLGNSAIRLPSHGKPIPLAATAMKSATIRHLCQAVNRSEERRVGKE